jgi:hypothetical protein
MAQILLKQELQEQVRALEKELEARKGLQDLDHSNRRYFEGILNNTNTYTNTPDCLHHVSCPSFWQMMLEEGRCIGPFAKLGRKGNAYLLDVQM